MDEPSWTAIGTIATAVGSIATAISVALLYFQIKAENKRARSNLAYEMCFRWTSASREESHLVLAFFDGLGASGCQAIAEWKSLAIEGRENVERLRVIVGDRFTDLSAEMDKALSHHASQVSVILNERVSMFLAQVGTYHLNLLESILLTWSSRMVDRDIIEQQFAFLWNPAAMSFGMRDLRKAIGANYYPALDLFTGHLSRRFPT